MSWMRLDPGEFRAVEIDSLDLVEFGLFVWLSFRAWEEGGLVDDPAVYRRALRGRITVRDFDKAWPQVRALMAAGDEGDLRISWVERVRDETIANLKSQAERQRQSRLRAKSRIVTVTAGDVTDCHRESPDGRTDGRTDGEKKKRARRAAADAASLPMPPALDNPEFKSTWAEWIEYRRQLGKPLTTVGATQTLRDFAAWGQERAIAAIRNTIVKGVQGLLEPDVQRSGPQSTYEKSQSFLDREAKRLDEEARASA